MTTEQEMEVEPKSTIEDLKETSMGSHSMEDLEVNPPKAYRRPVMPTKSKTLSVEKLRRTESGRKPMSPWERRKLTLLRCINRNHSQEDDAKSSQIFVPPYDEETGFIQGMYYAMHLKFHDLIVWKTQTSYSIFFVYVFAWYLIWINLFALLLYGAIVGIYDDNKTQCITSFEFQPDQMQTDFHQNMEWAFELSWTTFSTVGYGAISPSGANAGCYWVRYICAIEAAFGIIYFGFCSAIFFAKIQRILARAPVTFSSAVCIQIGDQKDTGEIHKMAPFSPTASMRLDQVNSSPYPILEFRIVNNKANVQGWEIWDAKLKSMVSIDVIPTKDLSSASKSLTQSNSELFTLDLGTDDGSNMESPMAKQTFHKLKLVAEEHPYFKRVWYCRHVLDAESPLICDEVREQIAKRGCWPASKSGYLGIRSALVNFNTIIITLTGTLNTTSNGVFIEKRYKYGDICVGYKFAGLLYLSDSRTMKGEKKVKTDLELIHDIIPQEGGRAEPLDKESAPIILSRKSSGYRKSCLKLNV